MPLESSETLEAESKSVQAAPEQSKGQSVRQKVKHKGGYRWQSARDHPGVSVVKRGSDFWLKWRTNPGEAGVYRYQWQRLHGISDKERAHKEAKRKSEELTANKRLARHHKPGGKHLLPVSAGFDAYMENLANERRDRGDVFIKRAVRGAKSYLALFTTYAIRAGIARCEKLTVDDLRDWRNEMGKCGMENVSINRVLDAVRAAMNFMADGRYITLDTREIGKALKHYPVTATKPRVLGKAELQRLVKALAEHDGARWKSSRADRNAYHQKRQSDTAAPRYRPLAPFVVLGLLTGARPGEIERITSADVHLDHGYILLREEKNNRERTVPMHDSPLLRELAGVLALRAGTGPIVGKVKLAHLKGLGLAAGIGITTDAEGNESTDLDRKTLRSTCVAHVASGSAESEYLLASRFGHGQDVSIRHYRQALHGIRDRGTTVEAWLGVEDELRGLLAGLGYITNTTTSAKERA